MSPSSRNRWFSSAGRRPFLEEGSHMSDPYYEAIGRRKTSRARVRVALAEGGITVNGKPAQEYFPRLGDMEQVLSPLRVVG